MSFKEEQPQTANEYFLSRIERHRVENITITAFYQSRSLTFLACIWIALAVVACSRSNTHTLQENLFHGFIAVLVIFLIVSVMIMPNGPFTRPHPALWRVVFGVSLFYFLSLVVTVFLHLDEARQLIIWVYPELKNMRHSDILDKEYAVNCSEVTLSRVYSYVDIFAVAHFFGWVVKALLMRHRGLAWAVSINWEVTELAFSHILPNFNECWWDSVFLDILLCNGLGIEFGLWLCRWLEMRDYRWESIRDIHGAKGKIKRAVLQFTPSSWTQTQWLHRDSSVLRSYLLSQLMIVWLLAELNSFFLKHVFIVKPSHPLTLFRLALVTFMSAPAIRQYYLYIIDPHVRRVGSQLWLFLATILTETLVCFKLGSETFEQAILWNLVYWVIWMVFTSFLTVWLCRHFAKSSSGVPADALPEVVVDADVDLRLSSGVTNKEATSSAPRDSLATTARRKGTRHRLLHLGSHGLCEVHSRRLASPSQEPASASPPN